MDQLTRRALLASVVGATAVSTLACGFGRSRVAVDPSVGRGLTRPDGGALQPWATGGTASLGEPPRIGFSAVRSQTCALTLGPCYAESVVRSDISEGVDGLPTHLGFKVVRASTGEPVPGAVVDVWHAAPSGHYSGEDAQRMCTGGDAKAEAARWFRGQQTTGEDGTVLFQTCFPGWYSSRAVHIHFQVLLGDQSWVVTQMGFDEALVANLFASHPAYAHRGQPDTSNGSDDILDGAPERLFSWDQAGDGTLVIWKTLALRDDREDPTC